jgi:hypothetical protein
VLLFHGSEPNRSDERRIGLAIRYIPTRLKQAVGQRDWATLVRGKDTYGHFLPEYVPKRDLEPEALAHHKAVSEEQVRVLYRGTGKTAYRAWSRCNGAVRRAAGDGRSLWSTRTVSSS